MVSNLGEQEFIQLPANESLIIIPTAEINNHIEFKAYVYKEHLTPHVDSNETETRLSKHFTLEEFIVSETATRLDIDNTPNRHQVANLRNLCLYVLEPIREWAKAPVRITSGFRSPELNKEVGGASNSYHLKGRAADITVSNKTPTQVYEFVRTTLKTNELIKYSRFTHVAY